MRLKFFQKIIDKIRRKNPYVISKKVLAENNIKIADKNLKNVNLKIEGKNNTFILEKTKLGDNARINVILTGDNNSIVIKKGFGLNTFLTMEIGRNHPNYGRVKNCRVFIDENTTIESGSFTLINSNSYINIGKNCMFANNVTLYNTDTHPVLDLKTGRMTNYVKGIEIGEHCWLGRNCTILKNTTIPKDCIIGWGAIVSGKFEEEHSVIAGNPARVVKGGVTWNPKTAPYRYIENEIPSGGGGNYPSCRIENKRI